MEHMVAILTFAFCFSEVYENNELFPFLPFEVELIRASIASCECTSYFCNVFPLLDEMKLIFALTCLQMSRIVTFGEEASGNSQEAVNFTGNLASPTQALGSMTISLLSRKGEKLSYLSGLPISLLLVFLLTK